MDYDSRGLRDGWGNCLKYLRRGWNRKEGRENKDFKKGEKLGQEVGALKVAGGEWSWNPLMKYVIHALNILLECIERNTFFKTGEKFNVFFISNSLQRKMRD